MMSTKKMGIRRRILLLLLATGLMIFLILSLVSFAGLYRGRVDALETGSNMGATVADFAEALSVRNAQERLAQSTERKAQRVERTVAGILSDAGNIAMMMNRIMAEKERYTPRTLSTPTARLAPGGRAYIYYSNAYLEWIASNPSIEQEIGIASNIAESLEITARDYKFGTDCYVASKNGYYILVDSLSDGRELADIPEIFLSGEYEPPTRPWYIDAERTGKPQISGVYRTMDEGVLAVTCSAPYYDGDGSFAGVAGVSTSLDALYQLVQEKNLGDGSINFALDENGCVAISSETEGTLAASSSHKDLRLAPDQSLATEAAAMMEGKSGVALVTVDGTKYYLAYAPMPSIGWSFGMMERRAEVVAPAAEIRQAVMAEAERFTDSLNRRFGRNIFRMAALLVLILAVLVYLSRRAARRIVDPILALEAGVQEIAKGNLDKKLDIRTGDEIESLSDSVNEMTTDLKRYMENLASATAEKERIDTELSLARDIQTGMLPPILPDYSGNPHFDLAACMEAAREVGGDFYDFYMLDDRHLALTIADVSEKGIPAALFMVVSKTVLKNVAMANGGEADLGRVMEQVNRQLCENNEKTMFVTMFFGVLDLATGDFSYVNAGHNSPLVGRATAGRAEWEYLKDKKKHLIVGVIKEASYEERRLTLAPGDAIFLYTDGVTEAMDGEQRLYTDARLKTTLDRATASDAKAEEILAAVRADIADHVKGAEQSDDITMMCVRFLGDVRK